MYTVIKNKVYNTDTATAVAEYQHGNITETLYRKKTGEYFCHFYDKSASDDDRKAGWRGKDKIAPYGYATARSWAKMNLDEAQFRRLFDVSTDEGDTQMSIRISKQAADKLHFVQSATGETIGQIVERLIMENMWD